MIVSTIRKQDGEKRYKVIGIVGAKPYNGVLVWTLRGDVHGIVGLRKASERERRFYAGRFGVGS